MFTLVIGTKIHAYFWTVSKNSSLYCKTVESRDQNNIVTTSSKCLHWLNILGNVLLSDPLLWRFVCEHVALVPISLSIFFSSEFHSEEIFFKSHESLTLEYTRLRFGNLKKNFRGKVRNPSDYLNYLHQSN